MQIKYSPDVDILVIRLRQGKLSDSRDICDGIIVHYSETGTPLEIEILDASKIVHLDDVDISWKELLTLSKTAVR